MGPIRHFRASYTILDTSQLSECHVSAKLTPYPHFYIAQFWFGLCYKLDRRKAFSLAVAGFGGVVWICLWCYPGNPTLPLSALPPHTVHVISVQ